MLKIPQYDPKCLEPLHTQNYVIAVKWNNEQVNDKLFMDNGNVNCAADPNCGHAVTIGDNDVQAQSWNGMKAEAVSRIGGQE